MSAPRLPVRPMGRQGLKVSMQGYGCMGLTAFYGAAVSDEYGIEVLQKAYDLGVTHYDTAEYYFSTVDGVTKYNEELIGKFLAKVGRDKVTVATKYFPSPGPKMECTVEEVRKSLDESLKRLGVDCVDLYYLHRTPEKPEQLDAWMVAAKTMVQEGKCKYLGLSEVVPEEIRRAHAIHPLTAIQQEWSLLVRSLEEDVLPTCRELGIAIVAYSPLCRGFATALVKKAEDWSKMGNKNGEDGGAAGQTVLPHLAGDNLEKNAALLAPLEAAAEKTGLTASQLSLAWVQAQGEDVFPIPGTTKIPNLMSNVSAAGLAISLDKEIFEGLSKDVDFKKMQGKRYPDGYEAGTLDGKRRSSEG
jgi:aryl-alcohol dehydrogenase-like predicted oxidoreductase